MQIHHLIRRTPNKKRMTVARGGKRGKTAGRGTKGQKARAGHKIRPEIRDAIKKLPKLRGRGKNSNLSIQNDTVVVSLAQLEKAFKAGAIVELKTLADAGLIEKVGNIYPRVKILNNGEIKKKLTIKECLLSGGAKAAIEKAGGTVNHV